MPLKKGQKLTDNPLSVTITVRLKMETAEKLTRIAAKEDTTCSEIIRRSIEKLFENEKK